KLEHVFGLLNLLFMMLVLTLCDVFPDFRRAKLLEELGQLSGGSLPWEGPVLFTAGEVTHLAREGRFVIHTPGYAPRHFGKPTHERPELSPPKGDAHAQPHRLRLGVNIRDHAQKCSGSFESIGDILQNLGPFEQVYFVAFFVRNLVASVSEARSDLNFRV